VGLYFQQPRLGLIGLGAPERTFEWGFGTPPPVLGFLLTNTHSPRNLRRLSSVII